MKIAASPCKSRFQPVGGTTSLSCEKIALSPEPTAIGRVEFGYRVRWAMHQVGARKCVK
jgi:hypothetical protein